MNLLFITISLFNILLIAFISYGFYELHLQNIELLNRFEHLTNELNKQSVIVPEITETQSSFPFFFGVCAAITITVGFLILIQKTGNISIQADKHAVALSGQITDQTRLAVETQVQIVEHLAKTDREFTSDCFDTLLRNVGTKIDKLGERLIGTVQNENKLLVEKIIKIINDENLIETVKTGANLL